MITFSSDIFPIYYHVNVQTYSKVERIYSQHLYANHLSAFIGITKLGIQMRQGKPILTERWARRKVTPQYQSIVNLFLKECEVLTCAWP